MKFGYMLTRRKVVRRISALSRPIAVVFDVDGVLTDGTFTYTSAGKSTKTFGSHDADALKILQNICSIFFVSADQKGFEISEKRIQDMGFNVQLCNPLERLELIESIMGKSAVVFVADSFTDVAALKVADISVVPQNAHPEAKKVADIVLRSSGGHGAVSEVCFIVLNALKRQGI